MPGRRPTDHDRGGQNGREGRRNGPRRHRARPRQNEIFAALDLGTNNCRLLIARPVADGFQVIDGFSRIVRLGEGVDETRRLSEAAMTRAVDAIRICAAKVRRRRVTRARYVATEAARNAENRADFVARVWDETGLAIEIITSREEAELTLAGCRPLLDAAIPHALVFDVGGGSAELVWLRVAQDGGSEILGWVSLPCGVVTLTERNGSEEFTPSAYAAIVAEIEQLLAPFERAHGIRAEIEAGRAQMLGTAGTVTTIAGVHMGLQRYNRALVDGSYLDFDAVREVSARLAASSFAERAAHPSIGNSRADLVVAGCAVLDAVCRTWPAGRMRVADRGVREGILLEMVGALRPGAQRAEPGPSGAPHATR